MFECAARNQYLGLVIWVKVVRVVEVCCTCADADCYIGYIWWRYGHASRHAVEYKWRLVTPSSTRTCRFSGWLYSETLQSVISDCWKCHYLLFCVRPFIACFTLSNWWPVGHLRRVQLNNTAANDDPDIPLTRMVAFSNLSRDAGLAQTKRIMTTKEISIHTTLIRLRKDLELFA